MGKSRQGQGIDLIHRLIHAKKRGNLLWRMTLTYFHPTSYFLVRLAFVAVMLIEILIPCQPAVAAERIVELNVLGCRA
jgi:hypothetical protein